MEGAPERVQLYSGELDSLIAGCIDEIHVLAQSGDDDARKMLLVGIEYRARLVFERWKAANRN